MAVGSIQSSVVTSEINRVTEQNGDRDPDVYRMLLTARNLCGALENSANRQASALLDKILHRDPDEPQALALTALCHAQRSVYNWSTEVANERRESDRFARAAMRAAGNDPECLTIIGTARCLINDHVTAGTLLTRARELNPASPWIETRLGWLATYQDQPNLAVQHFRSAIQRALRDPGTFNNLIGLGLAHFVKGEFAPAVTFMEQGLMLHPQAAWIYRMLVPAYISAGDEARAEYGISVIRKEYPSLGVEAVSQALVTSRATTRRIADALCQAGLDAG